MEILSRIPDSHISRKFGDKIAKKTSNNASDLLKILDREYSPDYLADRLNNLDYEYKKYISGLHYNSSQLLKLNKQSLWKRENNLQYISASCHNHQEINIANNLNLDFIILSPVLIDKSDRRKLGWNGFSQLVSEAHMPVLALGGISNTDDDYIRAIESGGHGIAGITKFWNKF